MTDFVLTSIPASRLLVFLHKHNKEKFNFTTLKDMRFFSNGQRLNEFLKYGVARQLIKRTEEKINSQKNVFYEIKAEANEFAEFLERLL